MRRDSAGFTLIELMIAVAVVAIIVAIAVPAYQEQVTKGRRIDGMQTLTDLMSRQERYYSNNNSYTTDLTLLGLTDTDGDGLLESPDEFYIITAATCDAVTPLTSCVELTATPQGGQAGDGPLTLNSRNEKTGNW